MYFSRLSIFPRFTQHFPRVFSSKPRDMANIVVKGTAPEDLCPQISLARNEDLYNQKKRGNIINLGKL
jgi:hypothetical protein